MCQLHRRFSTEQVKFLLQAYCQATVNRAEVQDILGIGKTRFFTLLTEYHQDPQGFSLSYRRTSPAKLSSTVENEIARQLLWERKLAENPHPPISGYNYSALRDRLKKKGISVSATTISRRAKSLGCYIPRRKTKHHDREVLTASIGALAQRDASCHLWSPSAQQKWTLITSIDDFSRKLLFAGYFPHETNRSYIQAAQALIETGVDPVMWTS